MTLIARYACRVISSFEFGSVAYIYIYIYVCVDCEIAGLQHGGLKF